MRFAVAALVSVSLLAGGPQKGKQQKQQPRPPDVLVVEIKIVREARVVAVEGRVRNGGERPLRGLVLFFEFLEPGGRMISRKNTTVTDDLLPPGQDGEFLAQTPDPVRAVWVRLDAEDSQGRPLRLDKPGPYTIE